MVDIGGRKCIGQFFSSRDSWGMVLSSARSTLVLWPEYSCPLGGGQGSSTCSISFCIMRILFYFRHGLHGLHG